MSEPKNWILLRGLARGTGHWGSFLEKIQQHFPQDYFEFIDLPGNGSQSFRKSPLHIGDYVKDLRSRSLFVQDKRKVHILSVSLGAMITVEWMRQHPDEVQQAFLVCTSSSGFSPFYDRFRPQNYLALPAILKGQKDPQRWEEALLGLVANSPQRCREEMPRLLEYSMQHPMQIRNIVRQLWAASRYRFPEKAPGSIKLVGSHGDRLVAPDCTLKIGKKWSLPVVMHPWAGHDIAIDDPQWLIEQLF